MLQELEELEHLEAVMFYLESGLGPSFLQDPLSYYSNSDEDMIDEWENADPEEDLYLFENVRPWSYEEWIDLMDESKYLDKNPLWRADYDNRVVPGGFSIAPYYEYLYRYASCYPLDWKLQPVRQYLEGYREQIKKEREKKRK